MKIQRVVLIGGGVLGSQIAYQCAYKGFDVVTFARSEGTIQRAQPKVQRLHDIYCSELTAARDHGGPVSRGLLPKGKEPEDTDFNLLLQAAETAYQTFAFSTDLQEAVKDADLIIEALPEKPEVKQEFYQKVQAFLPAKTILATNSSTLLPSMLAEATGRPERFLALHFANNIWKLNTAEIMGHSGTDPEVFQSIADFAEDIGMVPLCLKKEKAGYILNSMLVPFLASAQALLAEEIADVETIDKTWMLATGAPLGPFRILDIVGLETAYNIAASNPAAKDPASLQYKLAKMLKEDYLDQGKTGVNSGEGFYSYR